jgi:xanthine dehydrogenase YagR molybdenum-binding subunit
MELFTTTCLWSGDQLTIYEPSQFVHAVRAEVAKQLGLELKNVRVISRFVGGGFGSRGGITARTAWIALAARRINRPVKLVATRAQGFTIATYRAETRHHVRLGAARDGQLKSLSHEGWEVMSRPSTYNVAGTATTARLYNCRNVWTRVNIVHADRSTPGFMRAPPETPYLFALESAMDELAVALAMDPVELRRVNDTLSEPIKGLRYTSRNLLGCFDRAAAAFGWKDRSPAPSSMRNGDWLVGWGCAAATYHASISAAAARVRLTPEGTARVETAAHDIGTGALTAIAMTAADRLGLGIDRVAVEIGDSDLPPGGLAAGSTHTASVCTVVAKACEEIRERIARAATRANDSPFAGADPASLALAQASLRLPNGGSEPLDKAVGRLGGAVEVYAENIPPGAPPKAACGLSRPTRNGPRVRT